MTAVQTAKPVPLASIGARNQQAPKGMPPGFGCSGHIRNLSTMRAGILCINSATLNVALAYLAQKNPSSQGIRARFPPSEQRPPTSMPHFRLGFGAT